MARAACSSERRPSTRVNGIATFTDLDAMPAGTYTITFASAGLTSANTASFTVVSGAATQLTMQTEPAGAASGQNLGTQPVVRLADITSSPVTIGSNLVTATLNGAGGTLSGTTAVNAVNGVATFTNLKVTGAGNYTITFGTPGLTSVTSASFTIAAPPASSIALNVGATATANAVIGTNIAIPITADMANAQGQNLASLTFNFTWDPTKFDFVGRTNGTFGSGASYTVNTANATTGSIAVSIFDNDGFDTGAPVILTVTLLPKASASNSQVNLNVTAAGDVNGATIANGKFVVRPLAVTTP